MRRNNILKTNVLILLLIFSFNTTMIVAKSSHKFNKGQKWRIGYYEGGPYSDYTDTMRTLLEGLKSLGWLNGSIPIRTGEMQKPYWDWLSSNHFKYLSFKPEDAYSAAWDDKKRSENQKQIMEKLQNKNLDLVIAMGTWAGLDLANHHHAIPTMVLSTSDPIKAGIIKNKEKSGYNHVTARVDPDRHLRMIRMFHRIVQFKTLGIAFENTLDGRVYSAIDHVNKIADERGFKVFTCEVIDTNSDVTRSNQSCMDCFKKLIKHSDAIFVTELTCADRLEAEIAKLLRVSKMPSFSMVGAKHVKKGLMMSISDGAGYAAIGNYNALKFSKILNGASPESLNMLFEDPLDIAVNMETVRQIGFKMPKSILKIAAEIYEK